MSDTRDPSRDQPLAIPNNGPNCHDLVIADMMERKAFGFEKYGRYLQPNNGRSFLVDAYEEVLDLAVYLRGKIEEERDAEKARFPLLIVDGEQPALFDGDEPCG